MYTSVVFLAYCKTVVSVCCLSNLSWASSREKEANKHQLIDRVDNDDYSQSGLQAKSFYWHRAMASTPFYEDRGVGGVDVDCGADLDSDTNISGVASFIQ